jgi:hypothetical protein
MMRLKGRLSLALLATLLMYACQPVEQPEAGAVEITSMLPSAVYVNSPLIPMRMLCNSFPEGSWVSVNGAMVPVTAVYYGNDVRFTLPSVAADTPSPLRVEIRNKQGHVLASREVEVRSDPLVLEHLDSQAIPSLALGRHPEYPNRGYPEDFDVLMRLNPDGSPIFHLLLGGYDASQEPLVHRLHYVSSNGPESFGAPKPLPWGDAFEPTPLLTVDGQGVLHAAWNVRTSSDFNVMYTRSEDQGLHWTAPQPLTAPGTYPKVSQLFCTRDNQVIMAASAVLPGNVTVGYAVLSRDGGETWHWAAINQLSYYWISKMTLLEGPTGRLFSAFHDLRSHVVVKSSRDGGVNWFDSFITDKSYYNTRGTPPRARLFSGQGDRLFLTMGIWVSDRIMEVSESSDFFSISQDGGETWGEPIQLDEQVYGVDWGTYELLEADSTLYAVAQDNHFVTLSYSYDQGRTWSPPQFMAVPKAVAKGDERVSCPRAFIHDGRMYLFWRQRDGIHHARVRLNP